MGDGDAFVNPAYMTALAPTVPALYQTSVKTFASTGHAVAWEKPHQFISYLKQFIQDLH
jgi:hypothetical protein